MTSKDLDGLPLEWLVDNSFGYQDFPTFVDGTLDNKGGSIHFKRAGIYELVARTTDETGRVFLFETKSKTEVLPVLNIGFDLPQTVYTDTLIDLRTHGHNSALPMVWTLTKDGQNISVGSGIVGDLNTLGGNVKFKEQGQYVLTATMTDYLDRIFTHSESVSVLPVFDFAFTMPNTIHYGKDFAVSPSKQEHVESVKVEWIMTKDGLPVSYIGTLSKDGGTISVADTGTFSLTATDTLGRTTQCKQNIIVTNTAPTVSFTAEQTKTVKNGNFFVDIKATATNADGDDFELEWQGRTADDYYSVGSHTIKVRAKDMAGAYSPWMTKTITVTNEAPTVILTATPTRTTKDGKFFVDIKATATHADGDAITYVWEGGPSETAVYELGKHVVRVKAVDSTGAESPSAAVVFFVMDSSGSGGMTLTGPSSTINESGIDGATITDYTFTVPPVSGHSGNDYGRVRGYNILTNQWDQLSYGTTSNGITFTKNIGAGIYSKLEFYYYTDHDCMYNKSNITYTVNYHFE